MTQNSGSSDNDNERPDMLSSDQAASGSPEDVFFQSVSLGVVADLEGRRIGADTVRQVLLAPASAAAGQAVPCLPTPFGVRIRNGEIDGCLDLEGADITVPVALNRIVMRQRGQSGSIVARDTRIRRLNLTNCDLAGGIVADRAIVDNGIMIGGGRIGGPILLRGATVGGAVALEGTILGDGRNALVAAGAEISGPLVMRRAQCHGEVRLQRTNLAAGLRAEQLQVTGEAASVYCDGARIGGDVLVMNGEVHGPVSLENTTIAGGLDGRGLVAGASGTGINAAGLEIGQSLDLSDARIAGPLNLEGAQIAKRFLAEGVDIEGGELSIAADVIRIGGNWEMPQARLVGVVRCPGARIEGQLRCTGLRIFGAPLALRGDGARIKGGAYFSRAVIVGTMRFPAAEIHNQFRFTGATIKVDEGAALFAPGAVMRRDAELNGGFQTIGGVILDQAHIHGNCDLTSSRIKSSAVARSAGAPEDARRSEGGPSEGGRTDVGDLALSLVDTRIDRLEMPARADERPRGIVDLSRAHVGAFVDWAVTWPPPAKSDNRRRGAPPDHLVLDGFVYEHLENPAGITPAESARRFNRERVGEQRIAWLTGQSAADVTSRFKPQAWVYLSRQLAAQGLDRDARIITIERRRRERASRWATFAGRWESRFLDWFALYGFNPWRTVLWMALVIALFAGLWSWSSTGCREKGCFDETVFVTTKRDSFSAERFSERYPAFHPLAYSFDVFVPLVSFGYEEHWRPNVGYGPIATMRLPHLPAFFAGETDRNRIFADVTITFGGVLYLLLVLQKLLGLILTSVAVTGFTGLLRGQQ